MVISGQQRITNTIFGFFLVIPSLGICWLSDISKIWALLPAVIALAVHIKQFRSETRLLK